MTTLLPTASVIVSTHNRARVLAQTLDALVLQELPGATWEIVVVDDGSTDDTSQMLAARSDAVALRVVRHENARGAAAARNAGARAARAEILIFIDDDIGVPRDFVRLHIESLAAYPKSWIVGRVEHPPELRATPFGRYRDAVWEAFHESHEDNVTETPGITAANLSLPSRDFRELGGFDESFTIASCEDAELGMRARANGIRILYNPAIRVLHNDWAVTLPQFCERQRLYSISDVLLARKYGALSPRLQLVQENAPAHWKVDKPRLLLRKALKRTLASPPGQAALRVTCTMAEKLAPDSALCRLCYDVAVGTAIFRGVRSGIRRFGLPTPS